MGETNRKFGETAINEESSRSHTVFRVQFEIRPKERPDKVYFSFLNLIDLAGSEGVARAKTEGARKKYIIFYMLKKIIKTKVIKENNKKITKNKKRNRNLYCLLILDGFVNFFLFFEIKF